MTPEMLERWEIEARSLPGDIVIAVRQQKVYWCRVTSTSQPLPEFPGNGWTEMQETMSPNTADCYLLHRPVSDLSEVFP